MRKYNFLGILVLLAFIISIGVIFCNDSIIANAESIFGGVTCGVPGRREISIPLRDLYFPPKSLR